MGSESTSTPSMSKMSASNDMSDDGLAAESARRRAHGVDGLLDLIQMVDLVQPERRDRVRLPVELLDPVEGAAPTVGLGDVDHHDERRANVRRPVAGRGQQLQDLRVETFELADEVVVPPV